MVSVPARNDISLAQRVAQGARLDEVLFRRWLAAILDLVLVAAALWFALYGGYFVFGAPALVPALWTWVAAAALYYPLTEGLLGRSFGKFVASLAVVDHTGHPPGLLGASIRTFVRVVEVNPILLGGLPAAVAIAVSRDRRRLGDIAAETWVVPSEALARALNDPAAVFE